MKAIILNNYDVFGKRDKSLIVCNDTDNLEEIWGKYPYTEVESVDYVDDVMDKTYNDIHEDVEKFIENKTFKHLTAIILNIYDMFGKRYKMVILATDSDNLEEIWNKYPYTEVESVDYVNFVMDKTYNQIKTK